MMALLTQTLERLLGAGDHDDPRGHPWEQLESHGLLTPFQQGLSPWSEGAELIRTASRVAPGIPYAEQVASSYLHAQLGLPDELTRTTLADPHHSTLALHDGRVSGRAAFVPHASVSTHLWAEVEVAPRRRSVARVELKGVEAVSAANLAREPRDTLVLRDAPAYVATALEAEGYTALTWLTALLRATQMAALAEGVLALSLEHAQTRKQFGTPVGRFQAVQQHLARLGCEVAALHCAVSAAERAVDAYGALEFARFREAIAAAKVQAGLTAKIAAEVGHAVHAAMGFTREHALHRYTLRLLSYRAEFGADRLFARFLGEQARACGADGLWAHITEADLSVKGSEP